MGSMNSPSTVSEILHKATDTLALHIQELADLLTVSRHVIFACLSGELPSEDLKAAEERINLLDNLVDAVIESGLPVPNVSIMKRHAPDGRTLKDLIMSDCLTSNQIALYVQYELEHHEKTKQRISMLPGRRKRMGNHIIGIPAYLE